MSMNPIIPRGELHRRSRRQAMLEALVDDPTMKPEKLSAIIGVEKSFINNMSKSDAFQADLATAIRRKYGKTLAQVHQTVLDVQMVALKAMERQLNDDATPLVVKQGAAELVLDHAIKLNTATQSNNTKDESAPAVSITINVNDLARAQELAASRSNEIILEPSDDSHAKPLLTQEHSYLTARSKERDEV